mgnify:FL=1
MNLLFMIPQDHDTWNTEYRLNSHVYVMQVTPFLFSPDPVWVSCSKMNGLADAARQGSASSVSVDALVDEIDQVDRKSVV